MKKPIQIYFTIRRILCQAFNSCADIFYFLTKSPPPFLYTKQSITSFCDIFVSADLTHTDMALSLASLA